MITRMLRNPYYRSGSVICRLAVNFCTALWALIAFVRPNATSNAAYSQMLDVVPQWIVGSILLSIATVQTAWLLFHWRPLPYGAVGYLVLWAWWTMVLVLIVAAPGPVRAAPIACCATVVLVAAFAFASNPRRGNGDVIT